MLTKPILREKISKEVQTSPTNRSLLNNQLEENKLTSSQSTKLLINENWNEEKINHQKNDIKQHTDSSQNNEQFKLLKKKLRRVSKNAF